MTVLKEFVLLGLMIFALTVCCTADEHIPYENDAPRITIDQVVDKMGQGEHIVFIDCRNEKAWRDASTKVPAAIRIGNNEQLQHLVKELPKNKFVVAYCT